MSYAVKEIFATLQGEGAQSGRASVFCRFAGCNLWSGREQDRDAAVCRFCDTDFLGGGRFGDAEALADAIERAWLGGAGRRYVVFTGGEPLLQLDSAVITAMHERGFEVAVETNGTMLAPDGIDWLCVSPKAGAAFRQRSGDELKLVFPQDGLDPAALEALDFRHFFLQPMDGPARAENTKAAVAACLARPRWRLGVQAHKMIGIP